MRTLTGVQIVAKLRRYVHGETSRFSSAISPIIVKSTAPFKLRHKRRAVSWVFRVKGVSQGDSNTLYVADVPLNVPAILLAVVLHMGVLFVTRAKVSMRGVNCLLFKTC